MRLFVFLILVIPLCILAQQKKLEEVGDYYVTYAILDANGEIEGYQEIFIDENTPKETLQTYLDFHQFKAIEYNKYASRFPFRFQQKKGNWILYDSDYREFLPSKEEKKHSFELPQFPFYTGFCFVRNKKNQMALYNYEEMLEFDFYDEIVITNLDELIYTKQKLDSLNDNLPPLDIENEHKFYNFLAENVEPLKFQLTPENFEFAVRKKNKWARFKYFSVESSFIAYTPFFYDDKNSIPQTQIAKSLELEQSFAISYLAKNYNAVDFEAIDDYGYLIKFKDYKTKKVGFYFGEGEQEPLIPAIYDDLLILKNTESIIASNNNKFGVFNFEGEVLLPIEFDEIEVIFLDFTHGLAYRSISSWKLIDAFSGETLLEGEYASIEELKEAWWNRN